MNPRPPFTVEDIAAHYEAPVHRVPDLPPNAAGLLDARAQPYLIAVNANHCPEEQAFTIGHEVGHLLLLRDMIHYRRIENLLKQLREHRLLALAYEEARPVLDRITTPEFACDLYSLGICIVLGDTQTLSYLCKRRPDLTPWIVCLSAYQYWRVFRRVAIRQLFVFTGGY